MSTVHTGTATNIQTPATTLGANAQPETSRPVVEAADDFFSDAPLKVCAMRNNGDEICDSCQ